MQKRSGPRVRAEYRPRPLADLTNPMPKVSTPKQRKHPEEQSGSWRESESPQTWSALTSQNGCTIQSRNADPFHVRGLGSGLGQRAFGPQRTRLYSHGVEEAEVIWMLRDMPFIPRCHHTTKLLCAKDSLRPRPPAYSGTVPLFEIRSHEER